MFEYDMSLWGLFFSALIASTLLPGGSEFVFAYLLLEAGQDKTTLILVATVGNALGGVSSWLIGWLIAQRYGAQRVHKSELNNAITRLQRYGSPILLLSWLPIIGDPLCVAAGWLRINLYWSVLFISIGKLARYTVLALLLESGYSAWQAVL